MKDQQYGSVVRMGFRGLRFGPSGPYSPLGDLKLPTLSSPTYRYFTWLWLRKVFLSLFPLFPMIRECQI